MTFLDNYRHSARFIEAHPAWSGDLLVRPGMRPTITNDITEACSSEKDLQTEKTH